MFDERPASSAARAAAAGDVPVHRDVPRDVGDDPARTLVGHPRAAAADADVKLDLLLGYALAFGLVALVQALLAVGLTVGLLGLDIAGPLGRWPWSRFSTPSSARCSGLFASAFAETEFQAVQFMPAVVIPKILLCGLFVPRDHP